VGEKEFGVMKKWFLNLMICLAAIGVLVSVISVSLALCVWDEMSFWRGIATLLFNSCFLKIWINIKRHDV
jgi:quinol-cytochrome oxidoreductase complex cytochrome b subunit